MKNKVLLVLTILFSLIMVNSGLNKFFNYIPMPELAPELMAVLGHLVPFSGSYPSWPLPKLQAVF